MSIKMETIVNQIPVPSDQQQAFDMRCKAEGLDPGGFDLCTYQGGPVGQSLQMTVYIGKREYKYAIAPHDYGWVEQFILDLRAGGSDV